jgi:hypothetical protein
MNEIIILIAVISAISGASLSVLKGYKKNTTADKQNAFKGQRLLSSLIIAIMTVLATIQFGAITDQFGILGYIGLAITYLVLGFGTDQGLSHLDK